MPVGAPTSDQSAGHHRPPLQLTLPLEVAPDPVRQRLRDAHTYPLVSPRTADLGRATDDIAYSWRVPAHLAWEYPSLELRAANSWPAVILDLDGQTAAERLQEAVEAGMPAPGWTVRRDRPGGGLHAVWGLLRPVHRGTDARQAPLTLFARVCEFYAEMVQADRGYAGVLTHNPAARSPVAELHGLVTAWGPPEPYELRDLAAIIPRRWRRALIPLTEPGRNCALFALGMRWAGSAANLDHPVAPLLHTRNVEEYAPTPAGALPVREVDGIARSVERYRRQWIARGKFYSAEEAREWGSRAGQRGGARRRARTSARDAYIVARVAAGATHAQVAAEEGLTRYAVGKIIAREAGHLQPAQRSWRDARARDLRAQGLSIRAIAARLGISRMTASRAVTP